MKSRSAFFCVGLLVAGTIWAQPILNTGACPSLTRYTAPAADNWAQFPIEPNPQSSFPTGTIQNALTPAQSINCVQVPSGLRAEIVGSELTPASGVSVGPLAYLIYFTFDSRGRVWALDSRDYPNTINSNRLTGGQGRIVILEDTNGDGALDNFKVFYSGLVIPTSLELVDGDAGVVVTVAPFIYFIPNNNDVAGTPQTLYSGMGGTGNFDTHGQTNSLFYSLDNWIYGHTGYNGGCSVGGVNCGGGQVWRFRNTAIGHTNSAFQAWTSGPANAHGIGQMEDGQIFQSGATGTPHNNHSIRRGVPSVNATTSNTYYPITGDRFMWEGSTAMPGGQYSTGSSASSGHDFYTARLLPQEYWSRRSFVCEGASKLCNQDNMVINVSGSNTGSTWSAQRLAAASSNIIASTDAWFAPLKCRTGPDGALWVLDWYNYLFLHNPATPGGNCQNGVPNNGCAWNNALRAKSRSRLYRIVPDNGSTHPVLDLSIASEAQLVAALTNSNFVWRMQAQKMLISRGFTASLGNSLQAILTGSRAVDAIGNDPAVTHAVWVLEGLGQFASDAARWDPILRNLLLHPAWGTRRNVLMAMPRTAATSQAVSDQCSVNDDHGHVRLQALVALAESPNVANERAIWTTFQGVDAHAGTAVTAAGIATSATRPCTPAYTTPIAPKPNRGIPQPRKDLRFDLNPDGFALKPHGQLASGELVVYDLRGHVAFRSTYNRSKMEWSAPVAKGLNQPIYFYVFRPATGGELLKGQIFLASNF